MRLQTPRQIAGRVAGVQNPIVVDAPRPEMREDAVDQRAAILRTPEPDHQIIGRHADRRIEPKRALGFVERAFGPAPELRPL